MVSRNKRIVAAFAAVAAMGMGLAGCGSDTAGDTKTTDDGGVVNITYMHRLPDSEGMTLVNDIVAKWNKQHPDIQVKATKFDGKASDMIKKLETDVKSGEAPDLAQVGYAELPEVFTKGLLQDVTQYAEQYKNDFASGPYSLVQVGGKAYGLPQDTGPLVYFYNRRLSSRSSASPRFRRPPMSLSPLPRPLPPLASTSCPTSLMRPAT